jgi:hypothetical protein
MFERLMLKGIIKWEADTNLNFSGDSCYPIVLWFHTDSIRHAWVYMKYTTLLFSACEREYLGDDYV